MSSLQVEAPLLSVHVLNRSWRFWISERAVVRSVKMAVRSAVLAATDDWRRDS